MYKRGRGLVVMGPESVRMSPCGITLPPAMGRAGTKKSEVAQTQIYKNCCRDREQCRLHCSIAGGVRQDNAIFAPSYQVGGARSDPVLPSARVSTASSHERSVDVLASGTRPLNLPVLPLDVYELAKAAARTTPRASRDLDNASTDRGEQQPRSAVEWQQAREAPPVLLRCRREGDLGR